MKSNGFSHLKNPKKRNCIKVELSPGRSNLSTRQQLSEYSIARASLEDVYFDLTGEHFAEGEPQERV